METISAQKISTLYPFVEFTLNDGSTVNLNNADSLSLSLNQSFKTGCVKLVDGKTGKTIEAGKYTLTVVHFKPSIDPRIYDCIRCFSGDAIFFLDNTHGNDIRYLSIRSIRLNDDQDKYATNFVVGPIRFK